VQTQQFQSPTLMPRLDALDAEFGCEAEQHAAGRNRGGGAPMDSTFRPTQFEFPPHLRAATPTVDASDAVITRLSLGRRASRRLARFLIVCCIGVSATLAWQSYGDAARAMIANSSPQLGWLAPQTVPVVPTAPYVAPADAASSGLPQLALGLVAVRQSVDQLTAQLAAVQQQMAGDIAKVQSDEQEILHKLPAAPPRPTAAPAHKPAPVAAASSPSTQAR
jgi:hypothetical protein